MHYVTRYYFVTGYTQNCRSVILLDNWVWVKFLLGVWNFDYGIMVPIQQNMLRAGFNTYYKWHLAWIYNFCLFVYVGFAWAQLCDKYEKRLTCKLTLRWPVSFKALLKCYLHPASCWRSWFWSSWFCQTWGAHDLSIKVPPRHLTMCCHLGVTNYLEIKPCLCPC